MVAEQVEVFLGVDVERGHQALVVALAHVQRVLPHQVVDSVGSLLVLAVDGIENLKYREGFFE